MIHDPLEAANGSASVTLRVVALHQRPTHTTAIGALTGPLVVRLDAAANDDPLAPLPGPANDPAGGAGGAASPLSTLHALQTGSANRTYSTNRTTRTSWTRNAITHILNNCTKHNLDTASNTRTLRPRKFFNFRRFASFTVSTGSTYRSSRSSGACCPNRSRSPCKTRCTRRPSRSSRAGRSSSAYY